MACGAGRLDGVGDDERRRGRAPSQPTDDRGAAGGLGRVRRADAGRRAAVSAHSSASQDAPAGDDGVAVDDARARRGPAVVAKSSTGGQGADPLAGAGGDRRGDRVLGGVLERAGQAQHLGRRRSPAAGMHVDQASSGRW